MLKNKLNIENQYELDREEEKITKLKAAKLFKENIPPSYLILSKEGISVK